jgi:hypothetical protein
MDGIPRQTIGHPARWRVAMWGAILGLFAIPAIAMQVTREINWGALDFAAAAVLLVAIGTTVELAMAKLHHRGSRIALIGLVTAAVMLVWADAAVGVF